MTRRVVTTLLLVLVTGASACSGPTSEAGGDVPSLLSANVAQQVDRAIAEATSVPTQTPEPTPVASADDASDPPVSTIEADHDTGPDLTEELLADDDAVFVIPAPAVPKNQPVFRQAQADGDGVDNPTRLQVAASGQPVDILGEVSSFIDRVDVVSIEGAQPGQSIVVAWRCIAFESSNDQPMRIDITSDSSVLGEFRCSQAGQSGAIEVTVPTSGAIVVVLRINPIDNETDSNMFVEYQLAAGSDLAGRADTAGGALAALPNDQRAADDGDSRSNPQGRDEDGSMRGEVSGPLGDSSDWSTFEFSTGVSDRVLGVLRCSDFVSEDGSATVTATIYRGSDVGVSLICTPETPESSRGLRFEADVTYLINVEFSGSGFLRWVVETNER